MRMLKRLAYKKLADNIICTSHILQEPKRHNITHPRLLIFSFLLGYKYSCLHQTSTKKTSYLIAQRLFAIRRYGGGMLYAALPLHIQRGCFRIRTHDQQVTKAQLYRCTT
ncbi:hypothetical protein HKD37_18G050402 [Glycine soja]